MVAAIAAFTLMSCRSAPAPADAGAWQMPYLIHAGTVIDGAGGVGSNQGILVEGGKIAWIGAWDEAVRIHPGARVLDASDGTVMPGLTDAHAHVAGLGDALATVSLVGTRSYEEVIDRIATQAARMEPGEWVFGRGWDQNDWQQQEFPTAAALDARVPDNPVWVSRIDGHAGLANTAAMRAAGITAATKDPDGGRILRDSAGNPTGVFIDSAEDLINNVVKSTSLSERKRRLAAALKAIAAHGLTGVHDAGVNEDTITLYKQLADEGALPIRVYAMLSDDAKLIDRWFSSGPLIGYRDLLTVRAVKMYADGALGSRGAALLGPYSDDPGNDGLMRASIEHLRDVSSRARKAGFQVGTHAIGDRAVRNALEAYEEAGVDASDRFRIEHLQVMALEDLPRLVRMKVIASMQPTHATSDMPWAEQRIGPKRILGAYLWRTILDAGGPLAFGSDFPVEEVNPWHGVHAAVTRQDQSGHPPGGWYPKERVSVTEALQGFSSGAAYAAFEEARRGRIAPGLDADLTITAQNPASIDAGKLYEAEVLYTVVAGRVVHSSGEEVP